MSESEQKILDSMQDAERKAWEALSGYKFWMFGYHAGRWVNYNNLLSSRHPSPFGDAVRLAREKINKSEVDIQPSNGQGRLFA